MTSKNTEIVVSHQNVDLKVEAKKHMRVVAEDSYRSIKQHSKAFVAYAVDYLLDQFFFWVDSKLSA